MKYERLKHTVKGYTLLEVMVGMALTGLIVLFGVSAVMNFKRLHVSVVEKVDAQSSIFLMNDILSEDISASETVTGNGNQIECRVKGRQIQYHFGKEFVLRQTIPVVDTFYFNTESVLMENNHESPELVNSLLLNVKLGEQVLPLSYYKVYPEGVCFDLD